MSILSASTNFLTLNGILFTHSFSLATSLLSHGLSCGLWSGDCKKVILNPLTALQSQTAVLHHIEKLKAMTKSWKLRLVRHSNIEINQLPDNQHQHIILYSNACIDYFLTALIISKTNCITLYWIDDFWMKLPWIGLEWLGLAQIVCLIKMTKKIVRNPCEGSLRHWKLRWAHPKSHLQGYGMIL